MQRRHACEECEAVDCIASTVKKLSMYRKWGHATKPLSYTQGPPFSNRVLSLDGSTAFQYGTANWELSIQTHKPQTVDISHSNCVLQGIREAIASAREKIYIIMNCLPGCVSLILLTKGRGEHMLEMERVY